MLSHTFIETIRKYESDVFFKCILESKQQQNHENVVWIKEMCHMQPSVVTLT